MVDLNSNQPGAIAINGDHEMPGDTGNHLSSTNTLKQLSQKPGEQNDPPPGVVPVDN